VVVLDIEMPEMDGLATLEHIRVQDPSLPVVMFSTLTEHGAKVTLEALDKGASDYLTKPSGKSTLEENSAYIRAELGRRILALSRERSPASLPPPRAPSPVPAAPAKRGTPRVLAVGSSTGGPQALAEFLKRLPPRFPIPVVITQHMPPLFTKLLAERLSAQVGYSVVEAVDNVVLGPGVVVLAPGDFHLTFERRSDSAVVTKLSVAPPENSCRPAVDVMLRSLVNIYGGGVLTVILTGMGRDGLAGSELVVKAGGSVFAQDEASSVVWGMPGFVTRAGLVDQSLPPAELGSAVTRRVSTTPNMPEALA
jgi:two-component system chemotaxis response regulator CheB